MGSGSSASVQAAVQSSSVAELEVAFKDLNEEQKEKIRAILAAPARPMRQMNNVPMGKWTDEECADAIKGILGGLNKACPPEMFRKIRPFHLPDYVSTIKLGQDAPDGKVFELDGTETTLLAKIASLGHGPGKLMVLNFGSYTCPVHRGQQQTLSAYCKELSVDVLQIYIKEAHPTGEWAAPVDGTPYDQPTTLEARLVTANTFVKAIGVKESMVVDDITNPCNEAYEAVATKAYVIEGGKIIWRTGISPFQYDVEGLKDFLASKKGSA